MNIPRFLRGAMWHAHRFPRHLSSSRRVLASALAAMVAAAPLLSAQTIDPRTVQPQSVNTNDPSEVFLKAYTSVQQAEKLEQEGKRAPALAKYRFAASLLSQLTQTDPNWQSLIVRYRLRSTTETIRRLEQKGNLQDATPPPTTASRPGAASEDELPTPDANLGPPGSLTPPTGNTASTEALDRTVAELKGKLAKSEKDLKSTRDSLVAAQEDKKKALAAIQKEKQDIAAAAEKDRAALIKQRDEMESQMQAARTDAQAAQKKFDQTRADRDGLQTKLSKAEDRLKDISSKGPDALQTRKELRDQVADLKRQLLHAQGDMDNVAKTRQEFDVRVAQDEEKITALTKERDTAAAQVELTRDAAHRIEELQSQNTTLNQKLTAAETQIVTLTEEAGKKKDELAGMQQELTGLRDQLASTRDQADRSATTITELRQQLDEGAKKLDDMKAKGMTGEDFARMTHENELLRGIVLKQLKEQSRKAAARKLLNDELARLDVQSTTLNAQIEELGRPSNPLTDEERALFKDPQVTIADAEASTSLAVTIQQVGSGKPGDQPADAASPTPAVDNKASARNDDPLPDNTAVNDDHQPRSASNHGSNGAPKVVTNSPLVSEELLPMAREALDDFSRGKYTDAERIYTQLLARDPKNPYLLSNQGVVLFRQDKLKSAEVALKKALAITPKDAFCLATLGIVYYRMHRYDDALTYLTQAIQLDPRNATAHNYLGITSSQKGWPEAALAEIQKALSINPNYADAHFNIAVIYATTQPPAKDRAQEHYRIATSLGATPDPTLEKMIQY